MPNRIIKESICISEDFNNLSWYEQSFFMRLIVTVDDYGRYDARPAVLKGRMFPLKAISDKQMCATLQKLSGAGLIKLYTVEGGNYFEICAWDKHQRMRAKKSKFPQPLSSDVKCPPMTSNVAVIQSNPNPNPNPESNPNAREASFTPPTLEQIKAYCKDRGNSVDAQRLRDFYEGKGWMVGKNKMKDWKAVVRTWEGEDKNAGHNRQAHGSDAAGAKGKFNVETLSI